MKFSLLVPTRERPNRLEHFLETVYRNTIHKKDMEILIGCDYDDLASQKKVDELTIQYAGQMDIKKFSRERSEMLNEDYYNWLARQASGELMWVLGDDLEIVAPWDEIVWNTYESLLKKKEFVDKVAVFNIRDNTPPPSHTLPKFPCFPMVSREAMKATRGWILHPKVPTWGADYITYCIFNPIGRLIPIQNQNYLNHISWHTKQIVPDATNIRIGNIFNRLKNIPHYNTDRILSEEVPAIRGQVKEYIIQHGGQLFDERME